MSTNAICAIATAKGSSALGIIRVSGNDLVSMLEHLFTKKLYDRKATLTDIKKGDILFDNCIVILYCAPKSYTGEDVIEIITHGNPVIMNSIIDLLCSSGVAHAAPGEFTERAFLNSKITLEKAEATADLIAASDIQAVRAAQNSLTGKFFVDISKISSSIVALRAELESIINFPEDEDAPDLNNKRIRDQINNVNNKLERVIINSKEGRKLNDKRVYAFIGRPNSGKSSIINCLLNEDASIVTSNEGTTRDCIEYELNINNKIVSVIDTAGIRFTQDEAEIEGIERSLKTIQKAHKIFYVVDQSKGLNDDDHNILKSNNINNYHIVFNKIDLGGTKAKVLKKSPPEIYISAIKREGLDLIKSTIEEDFVKVDMSQDIYLARSRHINHLVDAQENVYRCLEHLSKQRYDILAEDMRLAHLALSSILGQNPSEELLEEIFTSFCIGK
tara:strand:- start:304 stop:1641 length:1338 start_codon:yes stop_codon:yes gene_type:complete